jgi:hypothetical protein
MIIGLFIFQTENKIGWQKDTSTRYMTFCHSYAKKNYYNFRKNIIHIYYIMSNIPVQSLIIDNDNDIGLTSDLIMGLIKVRH